MKTKASIKRINDLLEKHVTTINGTLSYDRVTQAFQLLGNTLDSYEGDTEDWIYIGEYSYGIDAFIVGAYWHFTEWHNGQASDSYAALCSLGKIYSPNMESGPEDESSEQDVYNMLNDMAENN